MESEKQEPKDRIAQLQKERVILMEEMQLLVEQQVEASRLLGLNYDEQVRLQEQVDAEVARLAAEVIRLTKTLTEGKARQARDGQGSHNGSDHHDGRNRNDEQESLTTGNADEADVNGESNLVR